MRNILDRLGGNVRWIRLKRGLTQEGLVDKAELSLGESFKFCVNSKTDIR